MGVTRVAAEFLLRAKADGLRLGDVLTIGRQWLVLSPRDLAQLVRQAQLWPAAIDEAEFLKRVALLPYYLDPFLEFLGATSVKAMDISAFEGASVLHDLNQPIPADWENRHDLVFDGGSLEHIFHFPNAISNYMRLVKPGGTLMIFTVANNFCGHGFYQFSPEVFYRVLSPENGFEITRLHAVEDDMVWSRLFGFSYPINIPGQSYAVADPAQLGARVELVNRRQTALLIQAKKIRSVPIFASTPQQSDYQAAWKSQKEATAENVRQRATGLARSWLTRLSPAALLHVQQKLAPRFFRLLNPFLLRRWGARETFANRAAYRKIAKW